MFNTGWKNWKTVNVYPLKKRKTSSTWIGKLQVSSRNLGKQLMQLWWKLIEAAREDLRFQTRSFQNILGVKLASWSSCLLLACLDLCLETLDHHLQKIRCCSCWPRATSIYIYTACMYVWCFNDTFTWCGWRTPAAEIWTSCFRLLVLLLCGSCLQSKRLQRSVSTGNL